MGFEISGNDLKDGVPGEKITRYRLDRSTALGKQFYPIKKLSRPKKASDLVGEAYVKLSENFTLKK